MTGHDRSDDPELRRLLDQIGLDADDSPTPGADEDRERAERMLAYVLAHGRATAPSSRPRASWSGWGRRLTAAAGLAILIVLGYTAGPWSGGESALASTPPMLRFSGVDPGQVPDSDVPADGVIAELADRARLLPDPAEQPVQSIELDAWWASTMMDTSGEARSVLVPVRVSHFVLPDGDFRSIERRGLPLDKDGRVTDPPDWDHAPPVSDTVFTLDEHRGPEYPAGLPTSSDELRELLAPPDECPDGPGACLMSEAAQLHTNYVLTPELTANLWSAMRGAPDISHLGETIDRLGRHAEVISAPILGGSNQFLVLADPATGAFLGFEQILLTEDATYGFDPPAVISFTALVESRRIAHSAVPDDSATQRY